MGVDYVDVVHYDAEFDEPSAIAFKSGPKTVPVRVIRHADKTIYRIQLADLERL